MQTTTGSQSLKDYDPELFNIIQSEKQRQIKGIELIASENFTSRAVMECLGSCLTNKYSEGQVGKRYYGGNEFIDKVEALAKKRCLAAFGLDEKEWAVNVQALSGTAANLAVLTAILKPHDRLMGLDLPSGGHLSHGFYNEKKRISASSLFFESLPYHITEEGLIDYDELERLSGIYKPRLIICGASAYPRDWDYARVRKIADKIGAYVLCDMAHYAGLVATKEHNNPFEYCDLVTSTTHKSLRGPRAGIIFSRRKPLKDNPRTTIDQAVDFAVFPTLQGGPHQNQIAAIATQMKEVATDEFKQYAKQVKSNAKALAESLMKRGHVLVSGGTDNHLLLWNLRPHKITGSKLEKVCELVEISVNKNSIAGDKSPQSPYGIRLGTPAMTTRGLKEKDFDTVAEFLDKTLKIALDIQKRAKSLQLGDFLTLLEQEKNSEAIQNLRKEIEAFASKFPMPGI